jgi:hypothetical protein
MKLCALLIMTVALFGSTKSTESKAGNPIGRWKVEFTLTGGEKKHLTFEGKPKGIGSFQGLDTAADNKPARESVPAVWSITPSDRVTLSGDIELPLGTCCREVGTLLFKGEFVSDTALKGRAIFITSTTDEENFVGYRSDVGTFTASREP